MEPGEDQRRVVRALCYKTKICPWYGKGKCNRGVNCNFAHSSTEKKIWPVGAFRALHRRLDLLTSMDRNELLEMDKAELFDVRNTRIEEIVTTKLWGSQQKPDADQFDTKGVSPSSSQETLMTASAAPLIGSSDLLHEASFYQTDEPVTVLLKQPPVQSSGDMKKSLITDSVQLQASQSINDAPHCYRDGDAATHYNLQYDEQSYNKCENPTAPQQYHQQSYSGCDNPAGNLDVETSAGPVNDPYVDKHHTAVEDPSTASTDDDASRESYCSGESAEDCRLYSNSPLNFDSRRGKECDTTATNHVLATAAPAGDPPVQLACVEPAFEFINAPFSICQPSDEPVHFGSLACPASLNICRHSPQLHYSPPLIMATPTINAMTHELPCVQQCCGEQHYMQHSYAPQCCIQQPCMPQYYLAVPTSLDKMWFQNGSKFVLLATTCNDKTPCTIATTTPSNDAIGVNGGQPSGVTHPAVYVSMEQYVD